MKLSKKIALSIAIAISVSSTALTTAVFAQITPGQRGVIIGGCCASNPNYNGQGASSCVDCLRAQCGADYLPGGSGTGTLQQQMNNLSCYNGGVTKCPNNGN